MKRSSRRAGCSIRVCIGVIAVVFCAVPMAGARPYSLGADRTVSGPSGLTACTAGASAAFASPYEHTEVEPQVAVNPVNPDEITGVSQQDRWGDGAARGLSSWISSDGGTSWGELGDVPWSACQGGPERFGRVTDPWVSYDKAGNLYFIGQPMGVTRGPPFLSGISVTTWDGAQWKPPQSLIETSSELGDAGNDKVAVTGDPTRAGHAYAIWTHFNQPSEGREDDAAVFHSYAWRGLPMFARTTDAGETWSEPKLIRHSGVISTGNQIAVGPDGTLYDVLVTEVTGETFHSPNARVHMSVMRSRDGGLHWSAPVQIAPLDTARLFVSDDNRRIRAGDLIPDIAIDPRSGDIYVVWSDGRGTGINRVVMAKSSDGGRHWSGPTVVATGGPDVQSYNQSVDVAPDGTVALTYYDDRFNVRGDGIATTDVWLRHSHDGGRTWEPEQHLHGPFDHYRAPFSRGLFLGDYMGFETVGRNDLISFFASTSNAAADVHAIRADHP